MSRERNSPAGSTAESNRFADADIDRRTFVKLSAAAGAALALPGNAAASASASAFETEYEYVLNHTPEGHAVPTLVQFEAGADPTALEAFDENAITTTEPETAAYGRLTATEAEAAAAELPEASSFQFAPGSNPFWRIGYYPFGVFPEPRRSVDYIGFEQLKDGLHELEDRYSDRVRIRNVGQSPGHYNDLTGRPDPKGMYVAEVTNFDSEASFEEKEKVFFSCSLHGPERAGAEAGARVIENVARGSEPDIQGSDVTIEPLLDDMVIIFGFTNPDGWVARNPQYESSWQFDIPGVKGLPLYERGNAEVYDTNRQYPSVGYIIPPPGHYPAEPAAGVDAPDYVDEKVPDAAALVEHFRDYENLNYGADLHGGPIFNEFVLGLISQDQFDSRALHELYEMCQNIDDTLEQALEVWTTLGDAKLATLGERNLGVLFGVLPEEAFDYGTIYDTIGYTVSGAFLDWMAHPEITDDEGNVVGGGLGMTTLDFEMSFSWAVNGNIYNPELVRMEVTGYRTAIRTISAFGFRNTDTPSPGSVDEFDVTTETDGESVAYITTGETDALRRQDDDLVFSTFQGTKDLHYSGVIGPGATGSNTQRRSFMAPENANRLEATLSWTTNVQDLDFYLENSDGERIAGSANFGGPETIRTSIKGGEEYTFVVTTFANAATRWEINGAVGKFADSRSDDGSTTTGGTVVENQVASNGVATTSYTVDQDLHTLSVHPHAPGVFFDVELVSPSGETVYEWEGVTERRAGGKCCGLPEWVVTDPEQGTWTLKVTNNEPEPRPFEIQFGTLSTTADSDGVRTPDPLLAVGYEQRPYDVTPFEFFDDYAEFIDEGSMEPVSVDELARKGAKALDKYDHAVVIHDYLPGLERARKGATNQKYTGALDEFVDEGGNLVLTDTAAYLLPLLNNDLVDGSAISRKKDIDRTFDDVAQFASKNLDHPLFGKEGDVRPIQDQLWKVAPLGYAVSGEAQMDVVAESAFSAAAEGVPSVAGTAGGGVAAGSVTPSETEGTGVHFISSLLPPAKQTNLHPFGLLDYTVTFLGYVLFTSALGFEQVRKAGDTTRRFGRGEQWNVSSAGGSGGPAASGSRGDTNSPYRPGGTHQVDITITELSEEATVTDALPSSDWEKTGGDGTQDGATVDFGKLGPVGPDDDPIELRYFVEVPDANGQFTFGPAKATTDSGSTAFGGTNTVTVVGGTPNGGSASSSGNSLTDGHGFSADTQ